MRIPEGQISVSGGGLLFWWASAGLCWALQELLPTQPPHQTRRNRRAGGTGDRSPAGGVLTLTWLCWQPAQPPRLLGRHLKHITDAL